MVDKPKPPCKLTIAQHMDYATGSCRCGASMSTEYNSTADWTAWVQEHTKEEKAESYCTQCGHSTSYP
jgi:hypothetical protein